MRSKIASTVLGLAFLISAAASAQLRVGAAKVDITPDAGKLPEPFVAIHDHLFTRAILIENGKTSALLMNLDAGKISPFLYQQVSEEISKRYGIPLDNMVISAVHDHASVPSLGGEGATSVRPMSPNMQAFIDKVKAGMLEAVQEAKASLQPAEMGFGVGNVYLNVNRDAIDPKTRKWAQESNLEFPSDKTLAVIEFRKPNGGEPIAIYFNYAMHAVTMFLREQISGDFPEAAAQYVEGVYSDKVVAEWTVAAAGDQNPLYLRAINAIGEQRIHQEMDPAKPGDEGGAEYGAAIMRLFVGPAQRPMQPMDPKLEEQSWRVVQAIGTIMGEETLRVMDGIDDFTTSGVIEGASKDIACPGRKRLDAGREGSPGTYEDGPPVKIGFGALRVGDVVIEHNDSEIYNKIGQEAMAASPFRKTLMVGLANGGGGYIPTDDAFGRYTFQVVGNRLKPGCAEMGIVNGMGKIVRQQLEASSTK
jgi:hypothetical protein